MKLLEDILNMPKDGIYDFEYIAKKLMRNFQIRKVVDSNSQYYYFTDIEFYYYGPNHKDLSVHPHFYTKPGQFRVHYSGVDITLGGNWGTFEIEIQNALKKDKKYSDNNKTLDFNQINQIEGSITDDVKYGGILLRGIKEKGKEYTINGPWRVLCELFHFEGTNLELSIVESQNDIVQILSSPRKNISDVAGNFKDKPYRFTVK
jgi:hypothetical protein